MADDARVDRARRILMTRLTEGDEVDRLTWPAERLWELRDERLRALVAHAVAHSPWHARRLAGLDPRELTADGLAALPVMTKQDLMGSWDEISTDPRLRLDGAQAALAAPDDGGMRAVADEFLVMSTSGTSGTPTVVAWDLDGFTEMAAAVLRPGFWMQRQAAAGGAPMTPPTAPFVQATVGSVHTTSMSRQLALFLGNPMIANNEIPARTPLPEMVARLNDLAPAGLFGYASALAMLAGEAVAGRLHISPMLIGASSEPLFGPMASLIADALGTEPSNTYAVTEIGGLAARTSPGDPALRLVEDIAVYEVDDEGHLVVTNVLNRALPLIRYRMSDRVRIDPDPHAGPWTGRRLVIDDATGALFTWGDGGRVDAAAIAAAMAGHPAVVDYAVEQTPDGIAVAAWAPRAPLTDGDLDTVRADLAAALAAGGRPGGRVEVRALADPGELPQTSAGKRRRFIPLPSPA